MKIFALILEVSNQLDMTSRDEGGPPAAKRGLMMVVGRQEPIVTAVAVFV